MIRSIRYTILCIAIAILAASATFPAGAETLVGGTISENTTWTLTNSPYLVAGSIWLVGARITVEPGVLVNFNDSTQLYVDAASTLTIGAGCRFAMANNGIGINGGVLIADGTPEKPIVFDRRYPATAWGTITLNDARPNSLLDYCRISGSTSYSIYIINTQPTNPILITNCYLESLNGANQMIRIENGNPILANNLIVYNVDGGSAIYAIVNNSYGLYPTISMNSIIRTLPARSGTGVYFEYYGGFPVTLARNRIKGFATGVNFYRPGNDTSGSHNATAQECILHENNVSVAFRVGNYTTANSLTLRDNWLRRAEVSWGTNSGVTSSSDGDHWTLPFPDRSNQTSATLVCTNELSDPPFPEGDVDNDGDTDRDDAKIVGEYLVGNRTFGELPNPLDADADGSATIDARDMALIRAFAEGMIWRLPR